MWGPSGPHKVNIMDLNILVTPASSEKVTYSGRGIFTITAGKKLMIKTSSKGNTILNETVPSGKVWTVSTRVNITETNA